MQAVFTEEYYDNATDTTKPQFPDDLGDIPDYDGENDGYDENGDGDWDGVFYPPFRRPVGLPRSLLLAFWPHAACLRASALREGDARWM